MVNANQRIGVIYCLTCPEGKAYVGQTVRKLEKRLLEHEKYGDCKYIHDAIVTHRMCNITVSVLFEGPSEELDAMEKKYIKDLNTMHPNGYNIRSGGSNGSIHCQASREKMRQSKIGEKNHNYGKPRTEETRKRISEAKAGEKHHFYGKTFTDDHKKNCAKAHRKNPEDKDLPLYLVRIYPYEGRYPSGGFAVMNHPCVKNKYFTSKTLSSEEKYTLAQNYLNQANEQLSSQTK
jgi:group I intron endonuclease